MTAPSRPASSGVALVTGGSRGIGRALAAALTAAGWSVSVTGRDAGALQAVVDAGDAALALPGDAAAPADVALAVGEAARRLGPLDLVVANAGRFATGGPLWESDPDDWWRDVEVNVRGVALLASAALPAMVARGSGRLVALGSGVGNEAAPHGSAYGVAKTAVHRLVESLAAELAGTGVRAFTLSPGRVATDMQLGFPAGFTAANPAFLEPPAGGYVPAEAVAALLLRVARGELDALAGRYLHVTTDLPAALASDDPDAGTLRLVPWAAAPSA
jgi:3-oxoacyl-[acyl-carrier protein] reductase